jgi:hypothetical protein
MNIEDRDKIELVYGIDPWADDEISLLVVDQRELRLLSQMQDAKTWGEALNGFPELLEDLNERRVESDEAPLVPGDEFDFETEAAPDSFAYLTAINAEMRASDLIGKLDDELLQGRIRFEYGMVDCNRCFIKDDEAAGIVLRLLQSSYRAKNPSLIRDDFEIGWFQQGLFN